MRSPEGYSFSISELRSPKYIGNTKISVENSQPIRPASRTAHHEAAHAYVAYVKGIPIQEASVIPNEAQGSLGHVITAKPDTAVAMAAAALGHDGTSHDERVAHYIGNAHAGEVEARSILSGEDETLHAFGARLDDEGCMTGSRVVEVFDMVKGGHEVHVFIQDTGGNERMEVMKAKQGKLEIPVEWFPPI